MHEIHSSVLADVISKGLYGCSMEGSTSRAANRHLTFDRHVELIVVAYSCYPLLAQLYTERSLQFMENVIRISGIGKGWDTQGFLPDGAACARPCFEGILIA